MKKLLLLTTIVLTAIVSHAQQGAVTLANGSGFPIRNADTTSNIMATVALYGSTSTNLASDSTLTQIGATVNTFAPGVFSGGTRNIGAPGDLVSLQVRAWTGGFATYDLAFAAAQADQTIYVGRSSFWQQTVGGGTLPTASITGPGKFTGMNLDNTVIPEPSSIALGLLGLGAIVLFRRRK